MTSQNRADGTIPLDTWLRFLDAEYLSTFIRDGGASVKFAVTDDDLRLSCAIRSARCAPSAASSAWRLTPPPAASTCRRIFSSA